MHEQPSVWCVCLSLSLPASDRVPETHCLISYIYSSCLSNIIPHDHSLIALKDIPKQVNSMVLVYKTQERFLSV
jgi:hypothetical protein